MSNENQVIPVGRQPEEPELVVNGAWTADPHGYNNVDEREDHPRRRASDRLREQFEKQEATPTLPQALADKLNDLYAEARAKGDMRLALDIVDRIAKLQESAVSARHLANAENRTKMARLLESVPVQRFEAAVIEPGRRPDPRVAGGHALQARMRAEARVGTESTCQSAEKPEQLLAPAAAATPDKIRSKAPWSPLVRYAAGIWVAATADVAARLSDLQALGFYGGRGGGCLQLDVWDEITDSRGDRLRIVEVALAGVDGVSTYALRDPDRSSAPTLRIPVKLLEEAIITGILEARRPDLCANEIDIRDKIKASVRAESTPCAQPEQPEQPEQPLASSEESSGAASTGETVGIGEPIVDSGPVDLCLKIPWWELEGKTVKSVLQVQRWEMKSKPVDGGPGLFGEQSHAVITTLTFTDGTTIDL